MLVERSCGCWFERFHLTFLCMVTSYEVAVWLVECLITRYTTLMRLEIDSRLTVWFFFVIHSTGAAVTSGSQHNSTSSSSSVSTVPVLSSETESSWETLFSSSFTGPVGCCSWPSPHPSCLRDVPPSVFRLTFFFLFFFFPVRGKSQSKVGVFKRHLKKHLNQTSVTLVAVFWGNSI